MDDVDEVEATLRRVLTDAARLREYCTEIAKLVAVFGIDAIEAHVNEFLCKRKAPAPVRADPAVNAKGVGENLPKSNEQLASFFQKSTMQKCMVVGGMPPPSSGQQIQSYNILTKRPIRTPVENCVFVEHNEQVFAFSAEPTQVHLSANKTYINFEHFTALTGVKLFGGGGDDEDKVDENVKLADVLFATTTSSKSSVTSDVSDEMGKPLPSDDDEDFDYNNLADGDESSDAAADD